MSASDVVVVVLAVVVAVLCGAVVTVLVLLRQSLRDLRRSVDRLRVETIPLVDDLRAAVDDTVSNVDRVDRLITAAEGIEAHVDSASRLVYTTISSPVVKTMAFSAGVRRAGQRLRGRDVSTGASDDRRRARRAVRKAS